MRPRGSTAKGDRDRRYLRIGYLGTLSRDKGLTEFEPLIQRLKERGCETKLLLAGVPAAPDDEVLLNELLDRLSPNAEWRGLLLGEEKWNFLSEIDVFVFATRYRHEAQPVVVFEAMRSSVPVVAFGRGCIPGQLRSSGCLVPPQGDFVEHALPYLSELASDDARLQEARQLAVNTFEVLHAEAAEEESLLFHLLRVEQQ